MMAPPGVLSFYDSLEGHNTFSTSLLLSPFPSFSDCISQFSVFSDHDYFLKNTDIIKKKASTNDIRFSMGDRRFDSDIPSSGDKCEVMTPSDDLMGLSPGGPLSNGSTEISDNVFNDVTLVSRLDTPISADTDFLQGLDELDFDFDEEDNFEPNRGISLESFVDEALGDTMDVSINDNPISSNNDYSIHHSCNSQDNTEVKEGEEEDVYKKEFFLKHLGLQRAPASISTPKPTSIRKNRKRKHEESESNRSELLPCPPLSTELISPCFLTVDVSGKAPSHIHENNYNGSNSSTPLHTPTPTTLPLSVPSKLCSCASSDWKRTILYSTAKSSNVMAVQTSPSTASVSGIPSHSKGGAMFAGFPLSSPSAQCYSDTFGAQDTEMISAHGCLSPSLLLSEKAKESFEFDLLDKNELDEDTKDLLQWLDNQDTQTTIAGITSSVCPNSPLSVPSRSPINVFYPPSSSSSPSNDSFTADDLDAILTPMATQQSNNDLDRFQDLEAYVSDTTPPTPVTDTADRYELDQSPKLRLSILADISRDLLNAKEHAANKKDLFSTKTYHSHCFTTTNTPYHKLSLSKQSSHSDYWSDDSPFSTASSSLSSSPSSSPPHSPSDFSHDLVPSNNTSITNNTTDSKNLDLLDLFSDENAAWCL